MLATAALPLNATRSDRSFAYVASCDPTAMADGRLVISEETGKVKRRTVTSTCGVQEQPCRCGRSFLLVKAGHAGNLDTVAGRAAAIRCGDVYAVTVAGSRVSCTCPGAVAGGRRCKHGFAVAEPVATGDIPSPFENADADFGNVC